MVVEAVREGNSHGISVKGERFLEAVAHADTIIFDKTGTLRPTTSALLYNMSTLGISLKSMTNLLPKGKTE